MVFPITSLATHRNYIHNLKEQPGGYMEAFLLQGSPVVGLNPVFEAHGCEYIVVGISRYCSTN
jgi:hypothetical protein